MKKSPTVRLTPRGIQRGDLPPPVQELKFRFAPEREESRQIATQLRDLTQGPAVGQKATLHFYTDASNGVPVKEMDVILWWNPVPPFEEQPRWQSWCQHVLAPAQAEKQIARVKARAMFVDEDRKVRWANAERTLTDAPADAGSIQIVNLMVVSELSCPECGQGLRTHDLNLKKVECQCGRQGRLTISHDSPPAGDGSAWDSLWNGGWALLSRTLWGDDPASVSTGINADQAFPPHGEWAYVGPTETEDGEEGGDGEETSATAEVFVRMAPGARDNLKTMLLASPRHAIERAAAAAARELVAPSQEWGPVSAVKEIARRCNPEWSHCPQVALTQPELAELTAALGCETEKAAITRGLQLARAYPGITGMPGFGPGEGKSKTWAQWRALEPWMRTVLRCAAEITKSLDPDGDVRVKYTGDEIVASLSETDGEPERPTWAEIIRNAEADTAERYEVDRKRGTTLTRDDPAMIAALVRAEQDAYRNRRDGQPAAHRRVIRALTSFEVKRLQPNLGWPSTKQYGEQPGTWYLVAEHCSAQDAAACGLTRRLRVAVAFHSVNRDGEVTRRRDDGQPTGAHDLWLSRMYWTSPETEAE